MGGAEEIVEVHQLIGHLWCVNWEFLLWEFHGVVIELKWICVFIPI